jgi:UDP-N-acetyl-D-mannosaminuronate dehydrogenase
MPSTTSNPRALPMARRFSNGLRSLAVRRRDGTPKPSPKPSLKKQHSESGSASSRCSTATAVVAVIGIGYVGLGLVKAFSAHYRVIALDISEARIRQLEKEWFHLDNVEWTSEPARIGSATHVMIAVPTPLTAAKSVDSRHLQHAVRSIKKHAQPGVTIIIESSVAVGMTRELLEPVMRQGGFKGGMSPEVSPNTQGTP